MGFSLASLRQFNVVMAPDFMSTLKFNSTLSNSNSSNYIQRDLLFDDNFFKYSSVIKVYNRLMFVKIILRFEVKLTTGGHVFLGEKGIVNFMRVKVFRLPVVALIIVIIRDYYIKEYYVFFVDFESKTITSRHGCCIMNNSDPSMGDSGENMGLQKIDMRNFENNYVKEKNFQEFANNDITSNGDFMHIEEDIMSVLKNISNEIVSKDSNLFNPQNSISTMVDGDSDAIFSIADNADISGGLSTFERDLLGEVDAMEMTEISVVNVPSGNEDTYKVNYSESKDRIRYFERRIQRLCRRLRMKQSQLFNAHVKDEVHSLLDHQQNSWYLPELSTDLDNGAPDTADVKGSLKLHAENLEEVFDSDATASSSGNDSLDEESTVPTNQEEERTLKIPLRKRVVWKWLHERAGAAYRIAWLQSQILDLEYKIHQYTELYRRLRVSKSKVTLQDRRQQPPSNIISSCTATCGAGTGTGTGTGTGNVSVHTRLGGANLVVNGYHGSLFPNPEVFFNINSSNNSNNNNCSSETSNNNNNNTNKINNNINKTGINIEDVKEDAVVEGQVCYETSRTKCFLKNRFEKRKLIKLHQRSLQTTPSTSSTQSQSSSTSSSSNNKFPSVTTTKGGGSLRCNCTWPLTCVLCVNNNKTGIVKDNSTIAAPTATISSFSSAMKNSLVDPTYHPVLSQPSNASISAYLSALLKKPEFHEKFVEQVSGAGCVGLLSMQSQHQQQLSQQLAVKPSLYANSKRIVPPPLDEMNKTKILDSGSSNFDGACKKRKYTKRIANNSQDASLLTGGNQLNKRHSSKPGEHNNSFKKHKRKRRKLFKLSDSDIDDDYVDDGFVKKEDAYSSQPNSPYSTHSSSASKDSHRRKKEHSFDIDNFVIPPNTTQQPVIVKPKYKEILIPRWTVLNEEDDPTINRSTVPKNILQDLNFDVVGLHDNLEIQEKLKFRMAPHQDKTAGQNGRGRRRTDSCPEIGEINGNGTTTGRTTPVLSSDGGMVPTVGSSSANTTPVLVRPTPFEYNSPENNNIPNSMSRRNRTTSLCRGKMVSSSEYDNAEVSSQIEVVPPYEPRLFPLTDEEVETMMRSYNNDAHQNSFNTLNCVGGGSSSQKPAFIKDEPCSSRLQSPTSESTESILEDSNDNEWMREFLLKEQILESMK